MPSIFLFVFCIIIIKTSSYPLIVNRVIPIRRSYTRIQSVVTVFMEGNSLRCTVDIEALHRSMALDDAFATSIVGLSTHLAVIRKHHQAVVLIPVHLTSSIRRVIRYQCWITIGIIRVMVVTNLAIERRILIFLRNSFSIPISFDCQFNFFCFDLHS